MVPVRAICFLKVWLLTVGLLGVIAKTMSKKIVRRRKRKERERIIF